MSVLQFQIVSSLQAYLSRSDWRLQYGMRNDETVNCGGKRDAKWQTRHAEEEGRPKDSTLSSVFSIANGL